MPVNSYECLILLDPTKVTSDVEAAKGPIHATLEKYGSEILVSRKWDDRKLAYEVDGHKKGVYYLLYFKVDSLKVTKIDHDFRLSENILRHMITSVNPKWENEMLTTAKDETKFGFQLIVDDSSDAVTGEGGGEGDDRPRRPRRPAEAEAGKE